MQDIIIEKNRVPVHWPCAVTWKGLISELPGRKINFSFPNVFETQSEDWLIENPDPFDQAAPGSSCQTICVISSDFCLRVKWCEEENLGMGEKRKYQMNETKSLTYLTHSHLSVLWQGAGVTVDAEAAVCNNILCMVSCCPLYCYSVTYLCWPWLWQFHWELTLCRSQAG